MNDFNKKYKKIGSWIYWEIESNESINEKEAQRFQFYNGYNPMGYGFQDFKCKKSIDKNGKEIYLISWRCYSSCD